MCRIILRNVLENPRLWRFSSGSKQAENMIKAPKKGREGVCVEVGAKEVLAVLRSSFPNDFQRGENIRSNKRAQNWFQWIS